MQNSSKFINLFLSTESILGHFPEIPKPESIKKTSFLNLALLQSNMEHSQPAPLEHKDDNQIAPSIRNKTPIIFIKLMHNKNNILQETGT